MRINPIALKQAAAFAIDFVLICSPFLLTILAFSHVSVDVILWLLMVPWIIYMPYAEWAFGQTYGMKLMKTAIVQVDESNDSDNSGNLMSENIHRIAFKTAFRRHLARVSLIWWVIPAVMLLLDKQIYDDYVVVDISDANQKMY